MHGDARADMRYVVTLVEQELQEKDPARTSFCADLRWDFEYSWGGEGERRDLWFAAMCVVGFGEGCRWICWV